MHACAVLCACNSCVAAYPQHRCCVGFLSVLGQAPCAARAVCMQIESLLGKKLDSIYEGNASALRVLSVVGPEGFHLRDRALHVYSEAGRVYAFRDVCKVRNYVQPSICIQQCCTTPVEGAQAWGARTFGGEYASSNCLGQECWAPGCAT